MKKDKGPTVKVTNNYAHTQSFPVGGKFGTMLAPGENLVLLSVWAAILETRSGKELAANGKIVGPGIPDGVEPAPTSAEIMQAEEARRAARAKELASEVGVNPGKKKGKNKNREKESDDLSIDLT